MSYSGEKKIRNLLDVAFLQRVYFTLIVIINQLGAFTLLFVACHVYLEFCMLIVIDIVILIGRGIIAVCCKVK